MALTDVDINVRWAATEAISTYLDETSVPRLIQLLDDENKPTWEDRRICDLAAQALESANTPEATQALQQWKNKQSTNN